LYELLSLLMHLTCHMPPQRSEKKVVRSRLRNTATDAKRGAPDALAAHPP
jgi:hypothetical protein